MSKRRRTALDLTSLERGRYHVIVKETVKTEDGARKLPKLYLIVPSEDGGVRPEPFEPILEYFEDRSTMSYGWKRTASRAVGLLIDYGMAMSSTGLFPEWKAQGVLQRRLYRGFAKALVRGTAKADKAGHVVDQTGLHWRPLGHRQAGVLLSSLTLVFRWMQEDDENSKWVLAADTDKVADHPAVALRLAIELQMRRQASLLGHLKGIKREPGHSLPFVVKRHSSPESAVPTFPARYVIPFLREGFVDRRGRRNAEAELVAHLIFGLGVRESEPFHLFTTDVQFVGGVPWVFFHHPENGRVSDGIGRMITRGEYLQRFGLQPRNTSEGRLKAGWKGMFGDGDGASGFWLPIDPIRNHAALLLKRYLFVTRPTIMAARPRSAGDHPFLLVNPRRINGANTGELGDPYTLEAFEGAWERAVGRIGRRFDDPKMVKMDKRYGNTPHGGRHFFGKFLLTSGVEGPVIQRCLHHRTLDAHRAYTRLTPSEVNSILEESSQREPSYEPFRELRKDFLSQFENVPQATWK